jgi:integrase
VGEKVFWYARFWDAKEKRYAACRALGIEVGGKKERRAEAEAAANSLLPAVSNCAVGVSLLDYVRAFWQPDSPYFREAEQVKGHKVSGWYVKASQSLIRHHIAAYPAFRSLPVSALKAGIIRDFMLWEAERGVSGSRINRALQVLRIPIRYAVSRDEAVVDPFTKVRPAHSTAIPRGVLRRDETVALLSSIEDNTARRLAVLLGLLAGMRQGEVRGLLWEDVDTKARTIHIRHNWQNMDGLKPPKCNSVRDVPIPAALASALADYRKEKGKPNTGLVFERGDGRPYCISYFRKAFLASLEAIGISAAEQTERNLTFHSLRHTFVSMSRLAGVSDFEIQALAGHKSSAMMDRYSHADEIVEIRRCGSALDNFLAKS